MKGKDFEPAAPGWMPGATPIMKKIMGILTGNRGRGKKTSTRTPLEPKRAPAHHLHRWRDEGRANLVLAGIRLGVLDSTTPPVGPIGRGQFRTWKTLAVAVERERQKGTATS